MANLIITIGRECGSGGHTIAKKVAEKLNLPFYDKKIVDMAAVVYNSTVMITRLAKLYNRRASGRAAFRLACRWIVNIYIAGELGDMAQDASEWTADLVSGTLKPLAGVLGKAAEGGANGLLVRRLGLRAIAEFRPLINETK